MQGYGPTSESSPHDQGKGTLVPTHVRFKDENLICPSLNPLHKLPGTIVKGAFSLSPHYLPPSRDNSTDPWPLFLLAGANSRRTREVQTRATGQEFANHPDYVEGWTNEDLSYTHPVTSSSFVLSPITC